MTKEKSKFDRLIEEALGLILDEQKIAFVAIKERLEFEVKHQPQFLFNETPASLAKHELKVETEKSCARLDLL